VQNYWKKAATHTKSTEKVCARRSRSGIIEKAMVEAWVREGGRADESTGEKRVRCANEI
jgi:hypothetical protein